MTCRAVPPHPKGYTLLELLIGMTLMALLMAALVVGLRVGIRAWQHGEVKLREAQRGEERATFLTQQVSSLVPYVVESDLPELAGQWPILEATASVLRFISTEDSHFWNRSGLVLVEYAIVRSSTGTVALALHETPVEDDTALLRALIQRLARDPDTGKETIVYTPSSIRETDPRLMTGLDTARFEYLDPHPGEGAPVWVSKWELKPDAPFPAAVRLRWEQAGHRSESIIPIRAQVAVE